MSVLQELPSQRTLNEADSFPSHQNGWVLSQSWWAEYCPVNLRGKNTSNHAPINYDSRIFQSYKCCLSSSGLHPSAGIINISFFHPNVPKFHKDTTAKSTFYILIIYSWCMTVLFFTHFSPNLYNVLIKRRMRFNYAYLLQTRYTLWAVLKLIMLLPICILESCCLPLLSSLH